MFRLKNLRERYMQTVAAFMSSGQDELTLPANDFRTIVEIEEVFRPILPENYTLGLSQQFSLIIKKTIKKK